MSSFAVAVLKLVEKHNAYGDLFWRTGGEYGEVSFFINCNDLFWWGTADVEPLTAADLEAFDQSMKDSPTSGAELYCARRRKMRPQGACYKHFAKEEWPLFDACGPRRERDVLNPQEQPS